MEEAFDKILNEYEGRIQKQEKYIESQLNYIEFCKSHNLKEEQRVAELKLEAVEMTVFHWRRMHSELRELLNDWNS